MRVKVTRQCPQTTTFEEKGEPKRIRTEVPLLTHALPLGQTGSQAPQSSDLDYSLFLHLWSPLCPPHRPWVNTRVIAASSPQALVKKKLTQLIQCHSLWNISSTKLQEYCAVNHWRQDHCHERLPLFKDRLVGYSLLVVNTYMQINPLLKTIPLLGPLGCTLFLNDACQSTHKRPHLY